MLNYQRVIPFSQSKVNDPMTPLLQDERIRATGFLGRVGGEHRVTVNIWTNGPMDWESLYKILQAL